MYFSQTVVRTGPAAYSILTPRKTMCYIETMEKTITFRIPKDLLVQLEKLAKSDERSVSYVVRKAAEEYVARHKGGK
jgi:hypothetical protein